MRINVSPLLLVWGAAALGVALGSAWRSAETDGNILGTVTRQGVVLAAVLGAALLHEAGHLAVAKWLGVEVGVLRLDLLGARLELRGVISYGREAVVAAGGPFANLLAVALLGPLCPGGGVVALSPFLTASLGLGLLNLLPVGTLDGGRILSCGAAVLLGEGGARVVLSVTTGLFLGGLWLLSVYGLMRAGELLSLFVFCMLLLLRTAGRREA